MNSNQAEIQFATASITKPTTEMTWHSNLNLHGSQLTSSMNNNYTNGNRQIKKKSLIFF